MEQLKSMKEQLTSIVQGQFCDIKDVDAKELGEAVDMIKDLSEAIYYCTVTEAMEESKKEQKQEPRYYTPRYPYEEYRDMDRPMGRMYYTPGGNGGSYGNNGSGNRQSNYGDMRNYSDGWRVTPIDMRDYREGRSYMSRRNYMESKEMHQDKAKQMKELETYMKELSTDIVEMIEDATPDEKIMLQQKLSTLIDKIK